MNLTPVGIAVIIGHMFPIFFKFKGGKGVATALGVLCAFNLYLGLLLLATWLIVFVFSKTSSLSALVATMLSPFYAYVLVGNNEYFGATIVIAVFILFKHKANIMRLFSGKEHKF